MSPVTRFVLLFMFFAVLVKPLQADLTDKEILRFIHKTDFDVFMIIIPKFSHVYIDIIEKHAKIPLPQEYYDLVEKICRDAFNSNSYYYIMLDAIKKNYNKELLKQVDHSFSSPLIATFMQAERQLMAFEDILKDAHKINKNYAYYQRLSAVELLLNERGYLKLFRSFMLDTMESVIRNANIVLAQKDRFDEGEIIAMNEKFEDAFLLLIKPLIVNTYNQIYSNISTKLIESFTAYFRIAEGLRFSTTYNYGLREIEKAYLENVDFLLGSILKQVLLDIQD